MKSALVLVAILTALPLRSDTCLPVKNPVLLTIACGHVIDPRGASVANVDLEIVSKDQVVASTSTDAQGNFVFGTLPMGDFDLTTKTEGWHLFWPIRIKDSKISHTCKQPMEVKLGIKTCGASVSKKGYHPKF